jgi:hypothetical protein
MPSSTGRGGWADSSRLRFELVQRHARHRQGEPELDRAVPRLDRSGRFEVVDVVLVLQRPPPVPLRKAACGVTTPSP